MLTEKSGLKVGEDIFVCFSPERVDPGRTDWTTYNTPKVMGGMTPACIEVATAWYGGALETVVPVSSPEAAEMAKLLENTFRMINIGLVNELAIICERLGIDVWEVIEAAATKPFGFMKFTPGPGLGGHCIPIDPLYLSWKLKEMNYNARFIELASEINTNMPRYVVTRVMEALNERGKTLKGSRILVLGAAYKPDIDDVRESPAFDVIALMKKKARRSNTTTRTSPTCTTNTKAGKCTASPISTCWRTSPPPMRWSSSPTTKCTTTRPSWKPPSSSSTAATRSANWAAPARRVVRLGLIACLMSHYLITGDSLASSARTPQKRCWRRVMPSPA